MNNEAVGRDLKEPSWKVRVPSLHNPINRGCSLDRMYRAALMEKPWQVSNISDSNHEETEVELVSRIKHSRQYKLGMRFDV